MGKRWRKITYSRWSDCFKRIIHGKIQIAVRQVTHASNILMSGGGSTVNGRIIANEVKKINILFPVEKYVTIIQTAWKWSERENIAKV